MEERLVTAKPWFEEWFDSPHYHTLYQHRNDDEAFRFINQLLSYLQPSPGCKMLDLGCGAGRHSIHLANYGYHVTGIDLSANSIEKAKLFTNDRLSFIRGDMRESFGYEEYDYVFNFFTSFGYFDKSENVRVARNMVNALKQDGTLVIDYLNIHTALKKIVPFEVVEKDGICFYIVRWFDGDFIYKRIAVSDLQQTHETIFTERVHLFTLKDFTELFWSLGLTLEKVYGDYELTEFSGEESKRLILIFRK